MRLNDGDSVASLALVQKQAEDEEDEDAEEHQEAVA
jgi:hypothetical protein